MDIARSIKTNIHFLLCLLMTVLGGIFLLWFIRTAGCDVVYTDYIRIVSDYLPEVTDPSRFFVPDVLTRIPAAFLLRIINVELFSYSVTLDRLCSALGLTGCAFMIAIYMKKERLNALWFVVISVVIFSLNKWEIILNGTAWAHTVSFALFFLNYYLLDQYYVLSEQRKSEPQIKGDQMHKAGHEPLKGSDPLEKAEAESKAEGKARLRRLKLSLILLPLVILMFAGEYIASYAAIMTAAYIFILLRQRLVLRSAKQDENGTAALLITTLVVFCLYLLSRHFAVYEHAGTTDMSIFQLLSEEPLLIPRLFIKSFAGTVFGQQAINDFHGAGMPMSDNGVLLLGLIVILSYIIAIAMFLRHRLWEKTLFPMMLMLSGGFNHVLVTASRWIFLNDSYGLSSRYGAQFMIGVIGILLTLALCVKDGKRAGGPESSFGKDISSTALSPGDAMALEEAPEEGRPVKKAKRSAAAMAELLLSVAIALMFYFGNRYTTHLEIGIAPYREENYERMQQAVLHYQEYDPDELAEILEWHKDTDTLLKAMHILEDNRLNIFSYMEPASASAE